jgi:hypothetical protein
MNEPPPPYEVRQNSKSKWWLVYKDDSPVVRYGFQEEALIARDRLNAAYMQGWRDRDEADDDE